MVVALLGVLCAVPARGEERDAQQPAAQTRSRPRVTIYPLLFQAPIFGASIDLPSRPGGGGGGGDDGSEQSGSTDYSINGAWAYGLSVEANRWFAEFNGLWADVSAERTTPRLLVDSRTRLAGGRAGVRLVGGLSATGGFRRLSTELGFTLAGTSRTYTASTKPVLWDPLIGIDWRGGPRRIRFDLSFEGGGFGVGTDQEYAGEALVDWEFIPHVVLRGGYSIFHYKMTIAEVTVNGIQRSLVSQQTLNGPAIGIGFTF